jgi:hypothetical protein
VYLAGETVYGCSLPARRSFRLGTRVIFSHSHLDHVAVAGRMVAYGLTAFGVDTGRTNVLVRRLSDGRLLASFSATDLGFVESFSTVGSIVVKSDGAVAWIGHTSSIVGRGRGTEVFEATVSASSPTRLDSGNAIDPASLRLDGSTLTWRHGGAARHATLH